MQKSRKLADCENVAVCSSWGERAKTSLRLLRDKAKPYFLLAADVWQKKRPILESFDDVKPNKTQFYRSVVTSFKTLFEEKQPWQLPVSSDSI